MKKSVFLFFLIFLGSSLNGQPVNDVRITYAMNKTNPPSYTFKAEFNGEALKYFWYFSDNVMYEEPYPTHVFEKTNKYAVKVKVQDKYSNIHYGILEALFEGKNAPSTSSIISGKGKVKDLSSVAGCGLVIVLENGTTLIPVKIVPDFRLETGQYVELAYEILQNEATICQAGIPGKIHKIDLIAGEECKAYFTATNSLWSNMALMKKYFFSNLSRGNLKTCEWSFGDGTTSTEIKPIHEYAEFGEYEVCLSIETQTGCKSRYCSVIRVTDPARQCGFDLIVKKKEQTANGFLFYAISTAAINTWKWSFGDGSYSNSQNPQHTYEKPGTYEVTCTIVTANGCSEKRSAKVQVTAPSLPVCPGAISLVLYDPSGEINACNGKAVVKLLDEKGNPYSNVNYTWSNGMKGDTAWNLCHNKSYFVSAVIESVCQKNSSFAFLTTPFWQVESSERNCSFSVVAPGDDIIYKWSFGDGNIAYGTHVNYTYKADGQYEVTLTAISESSSSESSMKVAVIATGSEALMLSEADFRIYPNPAQDFLNVELNGEVRGPVVFEIIGMKGQTISRKVHSSPTSSLIQIYTGDLPGGIYLLRITGENRILSGFKFMKNH